MLETLLKVGDVARYLNLRRTTVYTWSKAGKLPALRVGNRWRFRKEDIDRWLQNGQENEQAERN